MYRTCYWEDPQCHAPSIKLSAGRPGHSCCSEHASELVLILVHLFCVAVVVIATIRVAHYFLIIVAMGTKKCCGFLALQIAARCEASLPPAPLHDEWRCSYTACFFLQRPN